MARPVWVLVIGVLFLWLIISGRARSLLTAVRG